MRVSSIGVFGLALASLTGGCSSSADPTSSTAVERIDSTRAQDVLAAVRAHPEIAATSKHWTAASSSPLALEVTTPSRADGALRFADAHDPSFVVNVTDLDARPSTAHVTDRSSVFLDVGDDTDVVHLPSAAGLEEARLLRSDRAPMVARYRIEIPAGATIALENGEILVRDARRRVRLRSSPMFAVDAKGARRALAPQLLDADGGATLVVPYDLASMTYPVVVDPQWDAAGTPLTGYLLGQFAVRMTSGKVLVGGGELLSVVKTTSIYEPTKNTWTAASDLPVAREHATASSISKTGDAVIVVGGDDGSFTLQTTTIFQGSAWKAGPAMAEPRTAHAAVTLQDGRVLVAGGRNVDFSGTKASAEIYDPVKNAWSHAGLMKNARTEFSMVLLSDGRVAAVGWADVEIYDPSTNAWTPGPTLKESHGPGTQALLLPNGKIFVGGGQSQNAEIVDVGAGSVTAVPMKTYHDTGIFGSLPDGRVLAAGGDTPTDVMNHDVAELYDPTTGAFETVDPVPVPCGSGVATPLLDGRLLLATGIGPSAFPLIFFLPDGETCKTGDVCASGLCVDGVCCATPCNGPCSACDVAGKLGTCSPVDGAPHDGHPSCAPYGLCSAGKCNPTCSKDEDCATGNVCFTGGTCAPKHASCDGDHTVTDIATGLTLDCAPYKCTPHGECPRACASADDCIAGSSCLDAACVAPSGGGGGSSGGCATSGAHDGPLSFVVLGLGISALGLGARRRRRANASRDRAAGRSR